MTLALITFFAFAALALLFLIVRRTVRFLFGLAVLGLMLLALLAGALAWWWGANRPALGPGDKRAAPSPARRNR